MTPNDFEFIKEFIYPILLDELKYSVKNFATFQDGDDDEPYVLGLCRCIDILEKEGASSEYRSSWVQGAMEAYRNDSLHEYLESI